MAERKAKDSKVELPKRIGMKKVGGNNSGGNSSAPQFKVNIASAEVYGHSMSKCRKRREGSDAGTKIKARVSENTFTTYNNRRKSWISKGGLKKRVMKTMQKSIHLLLAVCSDGTMFYALQQGINNSATFVWFLTQLTDYLDLKVPNWRGTHVLLMDNSTIHTSKVVERLLAALQIPTIFSGPASYRSLPVEYVFGHLKKTESEGRKTEDEFATIAAKHGSQLTLREKDCLWILSRLNKISKNQIRRMFSMAFSNLQLYLDLKFT